MATPVVQSSFSAGELSPHLFGRVDLNKYKIGAARMHNFLVDYRGGAAKRPGTRFVGKTPYWNGAILLVPFTFNQEQTYILEFGHGYFRVITRGGYVVDANNAIYQVPTHYIHQDLKLLKWTQSGDTVTLVHQSYPQVEIVRYGHADWRYRFYSVAPTVAQVQSIAMSAHSSGYIDPAAAVYVNYGYAVTAVGDDGAEGLLSPIARLYSVLDISAHRVNVVVWWGQWADAQYYNVYKATTGVGAQIANGSRMGFVGSTRALSFNDSNILPNFTKGPPIHLDPFAPGAITRVVITSGGSNYSQDASISISDPTGYGAVVSPVVVHGGITSAIVDYGGSGYTAPQVNISQSVSIPAGSGATAYASVSWGAGGIGAPGPVTDVQVLQTGNGYSAATTSVQITDTAGTGYGAVITAVISGGQIVYFTVDNGGQDYQAPIVTIVSQTVVGNAYGYAEVGPQSGTYPGAVAYFQQRLLFAATRNNPSTLWGSKPGAFHNFDVSIPVNDGDAFEFTLASQQINAIKYMLPMPGGLVVLTAGGAWQLSGTQQFAPVTPTAVMATPQAFNGCGDLPPITIGYEILFIQTAGSVVRNLSYNFFANIYTGADVTVLSSHLFANHTIVSWCYAEEPDKVIWAARDDGVLLSLTFLKEQEVAGWAEHSTGGFVKALGCVREGTRDVVYMAVERIDGTGARYCSIEQLQQRSVRTIEEGWFLDCALSTVAFLGTDIMYSGPLTNPAGIVLHTQGNSPIFTADWVGVVIRTGGGRFKVYAVASAYAVYCTQEVAPTDTYLVEETGVRYLRPQMAGTWKASGFYGSVGGLQHLEGMKVSVVADGKVQTDKTVVNGSITLDVPASQITVGLGYNAELQTLRLESQPSIQTKRKKIPALTMRVADTRGLWAGNTWKTLTEVKELAPSVLSGETPSLYTGDLRIVMDPLVDAEGQVCIRSVNALPANIVAVIPEVVLGDTSG